MKFLSNRWSLASSIAELSLLYWQIGRRLSEDVLRGERAAYGAEIVKRLAVTLTLEYGRGWGEKQLRHCLRVAEIFPDEAIVSAVRRQLSWFYLRLLVSVDDPLKVPSKLRVINC